MTAIDMSSHHVVSCDAEMIFIEREFTQGEILQKKMELLFLLSVFYERNE
jgi:hypothetical protein